MPSHRASLQPLRAAIAAVAAVTCATLGTRSAGAHFLLRAPACYSEQNVLGDPQKSAPCGQADPGVPSRPTGEVTTYRQGQMITVTIDEVIYHPGHYRIAIARDIASLPPDPPVTPGGTPCGSTVIDDSPSLPLLADGLLVHSAPFSGQRSMQVQLPPDFTCTNCVLQVVEFMSEHALNNPGGCFYHHCATVSVLPNDGGAVPTEGGVSTDASGGGGGTVGSSGSGGAGGTGPNGGTTGQAGASGQGGAAAPDSGTGAAAGRGGQAVPGDTSPASDEGCSCRIPAPPAPASGAALLALASLALFRWRRQPR